jgi:hypothetical protein
MNGIVAAHVPTHLDIPIGVNAPSQILDTLEGRAFACFQIVLEGSVRV